MPTPPNDQLRPTTTDYDRLHPLYERCGKCPLPHPPVGVENGVYLNLNFWVSGWGPHHSLNSLNSLKRDREGRCTLIRRKRRIPSTHYYSLVLTSTQYYSILLTTIHYCSLLLTTTHYYTSLLFQPL